MDELKFTSVADSSQMEHAKKSQELQNAVSPCLPSSRQAARLWAQDLLETAAGAAHRHSSGVLKEAQRPGGLQTKHAVLLSHSLRQTDLVTPLLSVFLNYPFFFFVIQDYTSGLTENYVGGGFAFGQVPVEF